MKKHEGEARFLKTAERWLAGIVGSFAVAFATFLIVCPPLRQSKVVTTPGVTQVSEARAEQSTVVIALYTAGLVFLFYSLNGLRLTKFTAGPFSGESDNTGSTKPLNPSPASPSTSLKVAQSDSTTFDSLSEEQKKILRTLWRYQHSNFGSEFSRRWTFKIAANTPDYPEYLSAVADLVKRGYVSVNPANDQCALTNEGIVLLSSIGELAGRGEFYIF